jgi:pantoate--beta-alanine ligase
MQTISAHRSLRRVLSHWRARGERIALVPTMGNLHRGHLSLVALAARHADRVVVSIFVNPSQFGPREDFAAYPRTLAGDRRHLRELGTDLLYTPDAGNIYPFGLDQMTQVTVPGLSATLCGKARPGHFDGVTSVVCRLFNQVQPDVAVFGRKDYQQLLIIQRMVADLHMPVRIVSGVTQRESDGLALSSRNQYLNPKQRQSAASIYQALRRCAQQLRAGDRAFRRLEKAALAQLKSAGLRADYFAVRAPDLGPPQVKAKRFAVLAAAFAGKARLIDNISVRV